MLSGCRCVEGALPRVLPSLDAVVSPAHPHTLAQDEQQKRTSDTTEVEPVAIAMRESEQRANSICGGRCCSEAGAGVCRRA
jgi:hypothetical protein